MVCGLNKYPMPFCLWCIVLGAEMLCEWLQKSAGYTFNPMDNQKGERDFQSCLKTAMHSPSGERSYATKHIAACLEFVKIIKGREERVQVVVSYGSVLAPILEFHCSTSYVFPLLLCSI